ncbi:PIG-L deacetylase family protein [Streptomyces sp. MZ04]|uniref:PIG-L deacetylase family protein n=1 Tax=Streptomyces sp. MZ04 TaxID=2559236 RepID=UPI00107E7095|nr:PIG-L deacetylase family protein [Streptomyces sp. MZ04]TGB15141.1 PIG-L family deacetylase [Streptomyces sp. MZ04]
MAAELQLISEDWSSALAVVAHPDDLEYGAVAAIARWTAQGKRISYCLATRGEAGIDGMDPAAAGPLREKEERASAAVVGVSDVEFLDHRDGVLEHGLPLRRDIARVMRRCRPDIIILINCRPKFMNGTVNQADHVAVGRAAIDAARDAGNRWVFRELLDEGYEPWSGARRVLVAGSPDSTHGVDVTEHFEAGLASLQEHAAYLAGLGDGHGTFAELTQVLRTRTGAAGRLLGCELAIPFEVLDL